MTSEFPDLNYDLKIGDKTFKIGSRTFIMGILNVTPDSFSDGGRFFNFDTAVDHAKEMVEQGADIIDVGGESTRPSSGVVSADEERRRIFPIIERLLDELDVPVSLDTYKPEVAKDALELGVHMINDVNALREPGMVELVAEYDIPTVIMHFEGSPHNMVKKPKYDDLVQDVISFLRERADVAEAAGLSPEKIIIDPGFGFSKYGAQNIELLRGLHELRVLKKPILIGTSRKSFIGDLVDKPPDERLYGSLASVVISIMQKADFVRVHDVAETADVVKLVDAVTRISE
jgi:dihydropteroate synthase